MLPQEIKERLGLKSFREQPDLEELMKSDSPNAYYAFDAAGQVIGLNLCGQGLTEDKIAFLWEMPELQALNLSENKLATTTIPAGMNALKYLNLSENEPLQAVAFSEGLPALEELDVSECGLNELTLPEGFAALRILDLRKNQLVKVTFEGNCPCLYSLDLNGNQLTEFELLAGFEKLTYLYLNDNQLERVVLPTNLPVLETLHLRNNKLAELPPGLLSYSRLETLYLHGNQFARFSKEVIAPGERDNSLESVRNYLRSQLKSKLIPLRQAKMILVGNGQVGKTSIRIKLLDKEAPLPKKGDRTPGLDIATYTVRKLPPEITKLSTPIDFQLNIWDFGGQGKYREIQQLFCSRKSLYLFVTAHDDDISIKGKEDYIGFEYWLSMVNAYSYDEATGQLSPVIHVVNKVDEKTALIDEKARYKIFRNIYPEFIRISCKTLQNFDRLEATIRDVLPKVSSDIFTNQYAEFWLNVKTALEERQSENHLPYAEYERICWENNMDKGESKTWIAILDRIGAVIYFGDHPDLKDWVILNPAWVKDAMFKALDSTLITDGILNPVHFPYIWSDYSAAEHRKLIALMLAYKLCYEQKTAQGKVEYIVPALLPEKQPEFPVHLQRDPDFQIRFDYTPFIPAGTVNKLMVYIHNLARTRLDIETPDTAGKRMGLLAAEIYRGDLKWKNNVIIHDPTNNAYAHVREAWEENAVFLNLYGSQVRPLYEFIFNLLHQINQDLKNTKYLVTLEVEGKGWYRGKKWRNIEELDEDGIDFFSLPIPTPSDSDKQKVFVSYARREDHRYLDLFVKGIKAHSEWEIFDDRHIPIGADWHQRLQNEVQKCDFAILLLGPHFFKSEYIRDFELERFITRNIESRFPIFSVLMHDCNFSKWGEIARRQFFVAEGQDYGLAKTHRDKQISYDLLVQFDRDGEIIPNPHLNTFHKNFVAKAEEVLKKNRSLKRL